MYPVQRLGFIRAITPLRSRARAVIVCTVGFVMCRLLVFLHILIAAQVVVVGGFYVFHVCCLAHGSLR